MRVLFNKTSFKTNFEPGIIAAATAKKNAELGSAGTRKFSGFSGAVREERVIFRPSTFKFAPIPTSIFSV